MNKMLRISAETIIAKKTAIKNKTAFEKSYWFLEYENKEDDIVKIDNCKFCAFPVHEAGNIICDAIKGYPLPMKNQLVNDLTYKETEPLKILTI